MGKLIIILLGAPGAGKGTQGELLSDRLGLYYFETSKILEEFFDYSLNIKRLIVLLFDSRRRILFICICQT